MAMSCCCPAHGKSAPVAVTDRQSMRLDANHGTAGKSRVCQLEVVAQEPDQSALSSLHELQLTYSAPAELHSRLPWMG